MTITKYGHCCLVIEVDGVKILTDPGNHEFAGMGADPKKLPAVDAVVITHEHPDHYHLPALQVVLADNPTAVVYTTAGVGSKMSEVGLAARLLEDGATFDVHGVTVTGVGKVHAEIYGDFGRVANTGILVGRALFYPGDAFTLPPAAVTILALPIAGTWMKIKEAVDYALAIRPKHVFPVHDGMLKTVVPQHRLLEHILPSVGVRFHAPELGRPMSL